MFFMLKKKKIYPAYVSKNKSNRGEQVILLMIPNGKGCKANIHGRWHYLAVKNLSDY